MRQEESDSVSASLRQNHRTKGALVKIRWIHAFSFEYTWDSASTHAFPLLASSSADSG